MVTPKQKSLASVYDIPLDIPSIVASLPSVAIIGGNERARAFERRLLLAGFTKPLLCDVNSKDNVDSVSFEAVQQSSPTIILITEDVPAYVRDILDQNKQPLIVDAREITAQISPIILGFYRAFGNLSDREIGQGTERVAVAVELSSPLDLIQFIHDLNCFTRGINRLDHYSYTYLHRRSFPKCLFPFLLTTMTLSLYFVLSMCGHKDQKQNNVQLLSRQASSVTASTSITLLAIAFLARPMVELIELLHTIVPKRNSTRGRTGELSQRLF